MKNKQLIFLLQQCSLHDVHQQLSQLENIDSFTTTQNEMRRQHVQNVTKATTPSYNNNQLQDKIIRLNQIQKIPMQFYTNNSPINFTIRFSRPCLFLSCLIASISILFLAEITYSNQIQQEKEVATAAFQNTNRQKTHHNVLETYEVQMDLPYGSGTDKKSLSYYHCGSTISSSSYTSKDNEILLLHGAAFTKENWVESEILQNLCLKGNDNISENGRLSVTALDLSVQADGNGLKSAFDSLIEKGVLSGNPLVVVTPSASGKTIVSMITDNESSLLRDIVKVWMPVASFAVMSVKNDNVFKEDKKGKSVTKRLVDFANAKGVEIKGGHPCYLDSPVVFVDTILSFLHDVQSSS
jgi:hypothetical protein